MRKQFATMALVGFGMAALVAAAAPVSAQNYMGIAHHTGEVVTPVRRDPVSPQATIQTVTRSGLTVTLEFADVDASSGVGFDDPVEGAARQQVAVDVWNYIDSVLLAGINGEIIVYFQPSLTTGSGALASAGTYYNVANGAQLPLSLERIRDGIASPGALDEDIFCQFNFGYNFYAGPGTPGGGQFDMFSVMLHEMTHGLGFGSLTTETGDSQFWDSGNGAQARTQLDAVMFTDQGDKMFNDTTGAIQQSVDWLEGIPGALQHRGTQLVALQGASGEDLRTPDPFVQGTSLSHWDSLTNASMLPSFAPTELRREYVPAELAALEDIGYTLEPTSVDSWQLHD